MADALDLFNEFKTILCMCPHCSSLLRLSQLYLRSDVPAPKTWLDEYDLKKMKLEKKEEKVSEREYEQDELIKKKKDMATQRGRKKVVSIVLDSLDPTSSKMLKKYNPFDIKPVIHPVDFVSSTVTMRQKRPTIVKNSFRTLWFSQKYQRTRTC